MNEEERLEQVQEMDMTIICSAGASKSLAYEAIAKAREGDFTAAEQALAQAGEEAHDAHDKHHDLLIMEGNGEMPPLSVLTTHAQDHFMAGLLTQELAAEFIALYRQVYALKQEIQTLKEEKQ